MKIVSLLSAVLLSTVMSCSTNDSIVEPSNKRVPPKINAVRLPATDDVRDYMINRTWKVVFWWEDYGFSTEGASDMNEWNLMYPDSHLYDDAKVHFSMNGPYMVANFINNYNVNPACSSISRSYPMLPHQGDLWIEIFSRNNSTIYINRLNSQTQCFNTLSLDIEVSLGNDTGLPFGSMNRMYWLQRNGSKVRYITWQLTPTYP